MVSIGIRYCGGCNPQIDRSGVITRLKEALKKAGMEVDFTAQREGAVDLVLLVNGCIHACLEEAYPKEGHTTRFISVKGEMVDSHYVKEDHIPAFLINRIADLPDPPSHCACIQERGCGAPRQAILLKDQGNSIQGPDQNRAAY